MMAEWHQLPEDQYKVPESSLTLPRSQAILAAVARRTDLSLEWCALFQRDSQPLLETIVVDFACDGVPNRNQVGIEIPERIVIRIAPDKNLPIEVRALRKGFPLLLHQNAVEPNTAPSLCLYAEPQAAVNRSWTAERFLQRIEEWLIRAATGSLHLDDQPVEQLFFTTRSELVLPHDYEARRNEPNLKAWGTASAERTNKGCTYTLHWDSAEQQKQAKLLDLLIVSLSPVVHGRPEENPVTLGQLHDIFVQRGADVAGSLREAIRSRVSSAGRNENDQDGSTMILLEIPVVRHAGGPVERTFRRAFLVMKGFLDLGQSLTVLMRHERKFYAESSGILQPIQSDEWRSIAIEGIDVLFAMSKTLARLHSGVIQSGPICVLVGAGSLGAAMLDCWLRSGWGTWSVVDNDYLKPHNLARHPAESWAIGLNKAVAAAARANELGQGANQVTAFPLSGLDDANPELQQAFANAQLVVDVTTDLDFPRKSSQAENKARHATTFLTPSAKSSVLMIEDEKRGARLRTLEAQYYRALLNEPWGETHLLGHSGRQWTGAGCRDKSTVMPYTAVLVHAANLAEQVRAHLESPEACIQVWTRNPATGDVLNRCVPCTNERSIGLGQVTISIDEGLITKLRALRQAQLPGETGGILLGYHDFNLNLLVVVDASPAPTDSEATATTFKRGTAGVKQIIESAATRTVNIVQYIGEWHSHPPKVSAYPSVDDKIQVLNLAAVLAEDGLPVLSLIVGDGSNELMAMLGAAI